MLNIECPQLDFELCIEPKKGIIMQNQVQKIKIWVRNEERDKAFVANVVSHLASSIKSDLKNSMSSSLNKIGNSK